MTLGEFRQLTKDMSDDADVTITICTDKWVHPHARYIVNEYELQYDNNPFNTPTGINLTCNEIKN